MSIKIQELDQQQYKGLMGNIGASNVPLWLIPELTSCYKNKLMLSAYRGKELVGVWIVPLIKIGDQIMARREYRYFPYSSPFLLESDNIKRRGVSCKLFKYLTSIVDDVNLPFDPEFKELSTIQGQGAFVEWRHTHILSKSIKYEEMRRDVRNHIKSAKQLVRTKIDSDYSKFNFTQAIKGSQGERMARRKSAVNLVKNGNAKIITAYMGSNVCGGILLAVDQATAYMIHSWKSSDAPRGTVSLLISEAVDWALKVKKLKQFDFEGSIIQDIDYYFSGFNCEIRPYGHVFWSKKKRSLYEMMERSANIPGRLLED
jgi:hypothetical protein